MWRPAREAFENNNGCSQWWTAEYIKLQEKTETGRSNPDFWVEEMHHKVPVLRVWKPEPTDSEPLSSVSNNYSPNRKYTHVWCLAGVHFLTLSHIHKKKYVFKSWIFVILHPAPTHIFQTAAQARWRQPAVVTGDYFRHYPTVFKGWSSSWLVKLTFMSNIFSVSLWFGYPQCPVSEPSLWWRSHLMFI